MWSREEATVAWEEATAASWEEASRADFTAFPPVALMLNAAACQMLRGTEESDPFFTSRRGVEEDEAEVAIEEVEKEEVEEEEPPPVLVLFASSTFTVVR